MRSRSLGFLRRGARSWWLSAARKTPPTGRATCVCAGTRGTRICRSQFTHPFHELSSSRPPPASLCPECSATIPLVNALFNASLLRPFNSHNSRPLPHTYDEHISSTSPLRRSPMFGFPQSDPMPPTTTAGLLRLISFVPPVCPVILSVSIVAPSPSANDLPHVCPTRSPHCLLCLVFGVCSCMQCQLDVRIEGGSTVAVVRSRFVVKSASPLVISCGAGFSACLTLSLKRGRREPRRRRRTWMRRLARLSTVRPKCETRAAGRAGKQHAPN